MKVYLPIIMLVTLPACETQEVRLNKVMQTEACTRSETGPAGSRYEMPPQNLGAGNVGLYTLTLADGALRQGRFAMLNCGTGQITRVEQTGGAGDIRASIEALRGTVAMTSTNSLANAARRDPALTVTEGQVKRQEGGRVSCACYSFYPEIWSAALPPDRDGYRASYVPPT